MGPDRPVKNADKRPLAWFLVKFLHHLDPIDLAHAAFLSRQWHEVHLLYDLTIFCHSASFHDASGSGVVLNNDSSPGLSTRYCFIFGYSLIQWSK